MSALEEMSIHDIMRRWPATIRVALRHGILCVGCSVSEFHTVEDAIREHEIDGRRFREELYATIKEGSS